MTGGEATVLVEALDVAGVIAGLQSLHPGLESHLLNEDGTVRRSVNLFVNDEDIRFLKDLETSLKGGDELSVVPAIAGG